MKTIKMVLAWIIQFALTGCLFTICTAQTNNGSDVSKPTLVRLSEHLMTGYRKGMRPVHDWRHTTTVNIDIIIFAILGVEEKSQMLRTYLWLRESWVDEFLTWDPAKFDNVTQISIPLQFIWIPDIVVLEFVDTAMSLDTPYVYVDYKGRVKNNKPLVIETACSLNTYYFPFDTQRCSISFTSWLHTTKDVNVSSVEAKQSLKQFKSNYMTDGEWDLVKVSSKYRFLSDHGLSFGEIEYMIYIRRRPLFYAMSLILPSIFLMVMDVAGFYLPPESGERISFKITLLLGYSVFLIIVSETLPATGTPLIGIYYVMCMAFLMISLLESIFIVRMIHIHNVHNEIPKWLKKLKNENLFSILGFKNKIFDALRKNPFKKSRNVETDATGKTGKLNTVHLRESPMSVDGVLPAAENSSLLFNILKEVVSIKERVQNDDETFAKECLQIAYLLDKIIFRIYLFVMIMFVVSLVSVWSSRYRMGTMQ